MSDTQGAQTDEEYARVIAQGVVRALDEVVRGIIVPVDIWEVEDER